MKRLSGWMAGTAVVIVTVALLATPAGAHAELRATSPVGGTSLAYSPGEVTLTFTEPVRISPSAIRLYDAEGTAVEISLPFHPDEIAQQAAVTLPELPAGGYVVTWRVVSADSHPVNGAFTFRIGTGGAGPSPALLERLLAAEGGSPVVGAVYGGVRALGYASTIALIGGLFLTLAFWRAGRSDRRARRFLLVAWVASLVTTALTFALQGPYSAGLPIVDLFRLDVQESVAGSRFGVAYLCRFGLLLLAWPAWQAWRSERLTVSRSAAVGLALLGAGLLITPGLAGHPAAASPAALFVGLDALHLGAAALWLGGLALLAYGPLRGDLGEARAVVARFSRFAFGAVIVVLLTGLIHGWLQSRSFSAVTTTLYGRLLLVKLGLFAVVVGLAAISRSWVRKRAGSGDQPEAPTEALSRLRRSVAAELGVGLALLAVTALLVNAIPARTAVALPLSTELRAAGVLIELTIDPAKAGPVELHLYSLTPQGVVTEVEEVTARFSLPSRDIEGLEVPLEIAGPGHFAAYGFDIPIPGDWVFEVTVRVSDIEQDRASTEVRIR